MILPIQYKVDWELIRQQKYMQSNRYHIRENSKIVDHYYKVGDKVMLNNNDAYKYETPYKGPFMITQCWTNGAFTLQCGTIKIEYNILSIKPHTSDKMLNILI